MKVLALNIAVVQPMLGATDQVISQKATCLDCGKIWADDKLQIARRCGYAHSKLKGHEVKYENITSPMNTKV